jgi:hypothetical protein
MSTRDAKQAKEKPGMAGLSLGRKRLRNATTMPYLGRRENVR